MLFRSGVPPHIAILRDMTNISTEVSQILQALESLSNQTISGVTQVLENRAIGASTATRNGLQEMLTSLLSTQLNGILENRGFTENKSEVPAEASVAPINYEFPVYR